MSARLGDAEAGAERKRRREERKANVPPGRGMFSSMSMAYDGRKQ
jgi:hypothetical protein